MVHTLAALEGSRPSESILAQSGGILGPVRIWTAPCHFATGPARPQHRVLLTRPPRARSIRCRCAVACRASVLFLGHRAARVSRRSGQRRRSVRGPRRSPRATRTAQEWNAHSARARGWGRGWGRGGYVPARERGRVHHLLSHGSSSVQVNARLVVPWERRRYIARNKST